MKSFTVFTMKSKQVWMKPKPLALMKLNPSFYPCEARFHHEVISSALADFFRRKTDLVEKSTDIVDAFFWLRGPDLNQRPSGYEPDELPDCSTPRYRNIKFYTRDTFVVPETGIEPVRRVNFAGF